MYSDSIINDFTVHFLPKTDRCNVVYDSTHNVDVLFANGVHAQKTVFIRIAELDNILKIKLRDISEHSFNYTASIDWQCFDKMKREQCLEINYEEFQAQIIELLKQTSTKEMLMRLEADEKKCKVIFYEKSKIKSLILLTVDLMLTDQRVIIDEMSKTIIQLKDDNRILKSQLSLVKTEVQEKEILFKGAVTKNYQLEREFRKNLEKVQGLLISQLYETERTLTDKLQKLILRVLNVLKDVETIKSINVSNSQTNAQLLSSMQNLRLETHRNQSIIDGLKTENNQLHQSNCALEKHYSELQTSNKKKDQELNDLYKQVCELKKDMQEATIIIAQKTKTNDELGRDLVQANQMLVNFNNHYDIMSREIDDLKEQQNSRDQVIQEQETKINVLSKDFERYQQQYNVEEIKRLDNELFLTKQRNQELEKLNREAVTLNGLLTKKLSSTDVTSRT